MRKLCNLIVKGVFSKLFVSIGCSAFTLCLSSCSADLLTQGESLQSNEVATNYSIVCVIHGDGDYLYHDIEGNEYQANEEALAKVKRIAEQNPHAEVFIFHQRPRQYYLFFFPLRDGEFYYYRNGQLIANELYWRDQEQSGFEPETVLYREFQSDNHQKKISVFLYCGHEIPEFGGAGYDASYPDRSFTVLDFANGMKNLVNDSAKFDLMILSTCFGGTPYTIGKFGSFARTIIASPDNLHLSYFELKSLERLDLSLEDGDVPDFAGRFASQAFERLERDLQTSVSVAVYDVESAQKFIDSVDSIYIKSLINLKGKTRAFQVNVEHCDCADLPAYLQPTMSEGVEIFYRPARFGRLKDKKDHSGWECWKE